MKLHALLVLTMAISACGASKPSTATHAVSGHAASGHATSGLNLRVHSLLARANYLDQQVFVYELRVANHGSEPIRLRSLRVESNSGESLFVAENEELQALMANPPNTDLNTVDDWTAWRAEQRALRANQEPNELLVLSPEEESWIYLWIPSSSRASASSLVHRLIFLRSDGSEEELAMSTPIASREPLRLASPLRANASFIPANGGTNESAHRRVTLRVGEEYFVTQRHAFDFMGVAIDGSFLKPGETDVGRNESYIAYGQELLAVANGRVVFVRNDLPENTPGLSSRAVNINMQTVLGNGVVLDLENGFFAVYAHMQTGSASIRVGDRVERGQVIGRLGNSGNATAPHLHFHVCDANREILACEGQPFVFERFNAGIVEVDESGDLPIFHRQQSQEYRDTLPTESVLMELGP